MSGNDRPGNAALLRETERRLAEQIRTNAELEEALRAMELRALQSQVNPHFMFNTLSSISAMSFMENAPRTNHLVQALARLLRYTLRQIGQMVELREELDHTRDYLLIEEARFGDRIKVVIDVGPAVSVVKLPLLSIQPLVENAIIHGLEGTARGTLTVSARTQGQKVKVSVADDGIGMDEAFARSLPFGEKAGVGVTRVTGLGVRNVHRRLEHAFGEGYGLEVASRPGRGTVVTLTLPSRPREGGEAP